jgi:pyridoxal phosphate enzyme (YggS family)
VNLAQRIENVEQRLHSALQQSGRRRDEITLVAVTKKFSAEIVREAYNVGLRIFGENYVQEFASKQSALSDLHDAQFHLIGHLQSNKSRLAGELFQTIETVDSAKLARRLDEIGKELEVMIEVKLSTEGTKSGANPQELPQLIADIQACKHLNLTGLMTMPPWDENPEHTRPFFRELAALAREYSLPKLSMGMSHDFETAIQEGATHIRVGTAIFGPRPKPDV